MEMIAFRYGNHALIQLGKKIKNAKILVKNGNEEIIQTHSIKNKDFLLIEIPDQKKIFIELVDNDEIIVRSKL